MNKTINVDTRSVKEKFDNFLFECKWKTKRALRWIVDNKEFVMTVVPIVVSGTIAIVKVVGRGVNTHKQEELKNLYIYDRSEGHYWKLKRELTNDQYMEIADRKARGERLGNILDDMNVLKGSRIR